MRAGDCTGSYETKLAEGDGGRAPKVISVCAVGGLGFSTRLTSAEPEKI